MKSKVLIISSEFPPGPGGIGQHAYDLASNLNEYHQVTILANADYSTPHAICEFDKAQPFTTLRFKKNWKLTPFVRLIQFLKTVINLKPTHIIFTGLFPLWLILLTQKVFPNIKKIAIIHGHEPAFGAKWQTFITKAAISLADVIIPVSEFSKRRCTEHIKSISNIKIIPNGLDLHELSSWAFQINENLSLDEEPILSGYPILLTVGHTSPRKGQHNVIASLPLITQVFPDVKYYCIGRDVRNRELGLLAKQLGVEDKVIFLPPVAERWKLKTYYEKANILMLLSENQPDGDVEGFGIVALEANYFGTPVIGAKGCGVEDAVSDGHSGKLVDPKNTSAIMKAVQEIMHSLEKYKSNATSHAQLFNWDNIIKSYLNIIE